MRSPRSKQLGMSSRQIDTVGKRGRSLEKPGTSANLVALEEELPLPRTPSVEGARLVGRHVQGGRYGVAAAEHEGHVLPVAHVAPELGPGAQAQAPHERQRPRAQGAQVERAQRLAFVVREEEPVGDDDVRLGDGVVVERGPRVAAGHERVHGHRLAPGLLAEQERRAVLKKRFC